MVRRRQAAERQARGRERHRGGLPPAGPEERRINRECDVTEVHLLLRDDREQELLIEVFGPGGGFTIINIAKSKAKGDLDRLGRTDPVTDAFGVQKMTQTTDEWGQQAVEYDTRGGVEKLIADSHERRDARMFLERDAPEK